MKDAIKKQEDPTQEETRREFLVKAGKIAVYTPPALMLLMNPSKDALARSLSANRARRRELENTREWVRNNLEVQGNVTDEERREIRERISHMNRRELQEFTEAWKRQHNLD